jgi:murein DD-endopeptidase MepM/ murein hydrolase activator NlpD
VKPGDEVRRGQTLGRIGNTGNSVQPHLHFQIADSPETLSGEGLPYTHDRFILAGSCPGGDDPEAPPCKLAAPRPVSDSIPLGDSVVIFP